jgi:formylglycine-generating enzyme required for sulfatase activity
MGSDVRYSKERSAHDVMVEVLRIDRYTVTDANFATFVAAVVGAGGPSKRLPMLCNSTVC